MDQARFEITDPGGEGHDATIRIQILDPDLFGKDATFRLESRVEVHDSRAVNDDVLLYETSFYITPGRSLYKIKVPAEKLRIYTYKGGMIDIELRTQLTVDDSLLFDTKLSESHQLPLGDKPKVADEADGIIKPDDVFKFVANFKAIPFHNQVITLMLVTIGGILALISAITGIHDQFVPEAQTWFFSQINSDGESQSPIVGGVVFGGVIGGVVWFAMKNQLRKYMKFRWRSALPAKINPGVDYPVDKFFAGKAQVPLDDITLRIVACNMECGQYRRGSGSNVRTVSFREPIRGVVLFEKTVPSIPASSPISSWFHGDTFLFDDMFRVLYPPNMISLTHGIDVRWEIQLLHPEFVDQELEGPKGHFSYKDFLNDELEFEF